MRAEFITYTNQSYHYTPAFFQHCLQQTFDDPSARVHSAQFVTTGVKFVVDEKWETDKSARIIGIQKYELTYEREGQRYERQVLVKSKQNEQDLMKAIAKAFIDCGLDGAVATSDYLSPAVGFEKCDQKELEIYRMQVTCPAFRTYQPELLGLYLDHRHQYYILIMECLEDTCLSSNMDLSLWDREAVEAGIDTMGELHAVWYGKTEQLAQQPWMSPPLTTTRMQALGPLWQALAKGMHRYLGDFITKTDLDLHQDLLERLPQWWGKIDTMPKTLNHNDMAPKNIAIRQVAGKKSLCLFDWECSIIHLPQRDLCEFLCYVLPEHVSVQEVAELLERHRQRLEQFSNTTIDPLVWTQGFGLCLNDYLINRLALEVIFEDLEPRNIAKMYRKLRQFMEWFPQN